MASRFTFPRFRSRSAAVFGIIAALAGSIASATPPVSAYADQRPTDTICGTAASTGGFAATDLPDIHAPEAIVMGQDGTVYFEREADKQVRIASITKVMTAIVALENSQLTDTVTVDHAAATVGQSSADLKEGDTMDMRTALKCLLIPSGNDAAMAIASSVGKLIDPASTNPYQVFIDAMNKKAAELGMQGSLFENPHGLDFDGWEGNLHSTARDVATMFAYAMKNNDFRTLTAEADNKVTVTDKDGKPRELELTERNSILGKDGNIGGKTGGTYEALQCFVGGFSRETGGEVYTVVLGCDGDEERFADTLTLANWYYNHIATIPLANTQTKSGDTPIIGRATAGDWSDRTVDVTLANPSKTVQTFSLAGKIEQDVKLDTLSGSIAAGEDAGTITYTQNGKKLAEEKLVTVKGQEAPTPLQWLMVQFDRVVRFFENKPETAPAEVLNEAPDPTAFDAV